MDTKVDVIELRIVSVNERNTLFLSVLIFKARNSLALNTKSKIELRTIKSAAYQILYQNTTDK